MIPCTIKSDPFDTGCSRLATHYCDLLRRLWKRAWQPSPGHSCLGNPKDRGDWRGCKELGVTEHAAYMQELGKGPVRWGGESFTPSRAERNHRQPKHLFPEYHDCQTQLFLPGLCLRPGVLMTVTLISGQLEGRASRGQGCSPTPTSPSRPGSCPERREREASPGTERDSLQR